MPDTHQVERWVERFPLIRDFNPVHREMVYRSVQFPVLEANAVAYELEGECANYLMCIDGRTRVFRMSENGREMLIYKVGAGGTCVLTTQCLLSGANFPAQSIAEERTQLAALPRSVFGQLMAESLEFRSFVLDDYTKLLSSLFTLVDEVAFSSLEQRLARRLLVEANRDGIVAKTHQQLAADIGSVREVVSRILGEWADAGFVEMRRGQIRIVDRAGLVTNRPR